MGRIIRTTSPRERLAFAAMVCCGSLTPNMLARILRYWHTFHRGGSCVFAVVSKVRANLRYEAFKENRQFAQEKHKLEQEQ
jgi:hypothetical protein